MKYNNILLIDDDEDDREIFQEAVNMLSPPIRYTAMNCAIMAFEELSSKRIVPDVIFLDLNMPRMNGKEFLTKIKTYEDLKNIPIIIFSTSSNVNNVNQTKDLGASAYITKPYTFDGLVKVLESIL